MKETTNFLHLWKRWGFLFFKYHSITTIHVHRHTRSHLKWSNLAIFDFCLPQTESVLENGIKSMKLSQNLFFLNLSLRFPRGSLEKSQKFVLMEITVSLSVMLLLMSFRIVKPKDLLFSTFRDCSVFVVVVSLLSPFYISSWRSDTILASKTVLFCFFFIQ